MRAPGLATRRAGMPPGGALAVHHLGAAEHVGDDDVQHCIGFRRQPAVFDGVGNLLLDGGGEGRVVALAEALPVNGRQRLGQGSIDVIHHLAQRGVGFPLGAGIQMQPGSRRHAVVVVVLMGVGGEGRLAWRGQQREGADCQGDPRSGLHVLVSA